MSFEKGGPDATSSKSFNFSPQIAKVLSSREPAFADFLSRIEAASMDIKQTEELLRGYGICIPFYYRVEIGEAVTRRRDEFFEEVIGKATFLAWDEYQGKFRLLLIEAEVPMNWDSESEKYLGGHPHKFDHAWAVDTKPFIETKAKIRLQFQCALPKFIDILSFEVEFVGEEIASRF